MHLEWNNIRSENHQTCHSDGENITLIEAPSACTYKGELKNIPNSIIRLTILPNMLQGYIKTSDSWVFIDPLRKYSAGTDEERHVVFNQDDVIDQGGICGTAQLQAQAEALRPDLTKQNLVLVDTEVATDADYEYFQIYRSNTNSQIEGIINQVQGIYSTEVLADLTVGFQNVYTSNNQPYTSTQVDTLLDQFRNFWNTNHGSVPRDVAHLFTGKDLDGNFIGIAYVGVACNLSFAYGLSQDVPLMVKLVAHEVGHNFNAIHLPKNQCNGSGHLMCASIQPDGPREFCDTSIVAIGSYIVDEGQCLSYQGWEQLISGGIFSDVQGWSQPQYYSTIQVLAVGSDLYMIGRGEDGVWTYQFDASNNSWQNLTSGGPFTDGQGWNQPQYYSTIQIAGAGNNLYMIGRGGDGVWTYRLDGSNGWQNLTSGGLFTDGQGWDRMQYYSTIQLVTLGNSLFLTARGEAGIFSYQWSGNNWQFLSSGNPGLNDSLDWSDVAYYDTIQSTSANGSLSIVARAPGGIYLFQKN